MKNIYDENGYLNIEEIASGGHWLIVIIGARQVGKTYGTLKYMLDNNIMHILLRRTTDELELIGGNLNLNPYKAFEPEYITGIFHKKKLYTINDYHVNEKNEIIKDNLRGMALSLPQIAHIRGFNGSAFTDIVYDEFIPEKGVTVRKTEGDSLLNAYTTVNGNRELEGEKPVRLWLLANSNNIASPVLEALSLTDPILDMRRKGREVYEWRNALIVQPKSREVIDKRENTELMKHLTDGGNFKEMALNNEFAYDRSPLIRQLSIKGMKPLFSYNGVFYAWEGGGNVYICKAKHTIAPYDDSDFSRQLLKDDFIIMRRLYYTGCVYFADMRCESIFKSVFDID